MNNERIMKSMDCPPVLSSEHVACCTIQKKKTFCLKTFFSMFKDLSMFDRTLILSGQKIYEY